MTEPNQHRVNEIAHGYLDRWTARPGETLELKASSGLAYQVGVVRVIQGDASEAGPGRREERQEWWTPLDCPAGIQSVRPGSLAVSESLPGLRQARRVELELKFRPSLLPASHAQVLASLLDSEGRSVVAVALTGDGHAELRLGQARACDNSGKVLIGRWYLATLELDLDSGRAEVLINSLHRHPGGPQGLAVAAETGVGDVAERLVLAAASDGDGEREHFNGKLEDPVLRGEGFCYRWRLGPAADCDLRLVNGPMAGVTGHNWDGTVLAFPSAPEQYGALAFHEDDLTDAGWETTAELTLPQELKSGVYAVTLASSAGTRYVPFFVAPPVSAARPPVAVLMSTFTYLAYANEHVRESLDHFAAAASWPSTQDLEISAHRDFGLSLYDHHADGSGVCYSSTARPVLNLDPSYRFWLFNGPVHLGEDLYLLDWLERLGYGYDVITDHLLDAEGSALLDGYEVVLTGSHPEYASLRMLSALEDHVQRGGRLMYLGGNGFYWVTSRDPGRPGVIEIRRGHSGGRAWESEPGEGYHSTTGEPGGLWRHRGRPPNRLFGVGFSAQGADERAPGYRRVLATGSEWEFVFEGIGDARRDR